MVMRKDYSDILSVKYFSYSFLFSRIRVELSLKVEVNSGSLLLTNILIIDLDQSEEFICVL